MNWLTPIKIIGGPGSLGLLALVLLVAAASHRLLPGRRITRLARGAAIATLGLYFLLALPPVARAIVDALPATPAPPAEDLAGIESLFILDGDNFAGRVRAAVDVMARAKPETLWLLGPHYLLDDLELAGFPVARLKRDGSALNTSMQLEQVRALTSGATRPPAIVVSRVHAPRLARLARALAVEILLIPAPLDREPPTRGIWASIPQYGSLMASRDAIYEHAALRYYQWRGAMPPDVP